MPRYCATTSSASALTQPCSCCTMARQAITADCFWSAGYLATSTAKRALVDSLRFIEPPWREASSPRRVANAFGAPVRRSFGPLVPAARPPKRGANGFGAAVRRSSVDLAEHDVHRADDRHRVGDHVAAAHLV